MKRRLRDKLVLLVKGGGGSGGWRFPAAEHREGETIRATAERALRQAVGLPPLFFVGNAPMAHLEEEGGEGADAGRRRAGETRATTFFHLAQVLNDPWNVELARGAGGGGGGAAGGSGAVVDHAWVAPDELEKYLGGSTRLLELARRMV